MAEEIVDRLEPIEVEEVQREKLIATAGAGDQIAQPFLQKRPVREFRERIMMRKMV